MKMNSLVNQKIFIFVRTRSNIIVPSVWRCCWLVVFLELVCHKHSVCGLSKAGSSSFVQRRERGDFLFQAPKSFEILELVKKNQLRVRGSKNHQKAWRHWLELAVLAIRQDLYENLPYPVAAEELEKLSFELGVAADKGEMPSFSHSGARAGYALDYFCRARLLANLFVGTENPSLPSFWTSSQNEALGMVTGRGGNRGSAKLVSLGGGPGFDFVAAALATKFLVSDTSQIQIEATILDYEEGWQELVTSMNLSTKHILKEKSWKCEWGGKCDITKSIYDKDNAPCLAAIHKANIWTCQYCVAENAQKLRSSQFVFFRGLWERIPEDAIVIITETTPRLWPEFYDVVQKYCPFMQVSFPNQKGPQLILQKTSSKNAANLGLSSRDAELLEDFRGIAAKHEQRLSSGWERQRKKEIVAI